MCQITSKKQHYFRIKHRKNIRMDKEKAYTWVNEYLTGLYESFQENDNPIVIWNLKVLLYDKQPNKKLHYNKL